MKKFKIGIIGTENSHANIFANLINMPEKNGNMRFPDCRVTYAFGHYPESNENIVKEFGVDKVAESIEEMVENVDAVMVTARDGKFHYEFVKPFLEAGIPAFIDKPFTVNPNEAQQLISLAKEKNIPICGGSSLKFDFTVEELKKYVRNNMNDIVGGDIAAPILINSEYSGFFFYASHLAEMTLEIFGYNPLKISAVKNNNSVCATVEYENFTVTNHFNGEAWQYSATVYAKSEALMKQTKLEMVEEKETEDFVNMLRTGKMSRSYEQYVMPVYYMNAVKKAYETGEKVEITFKI